LAAKPQQPATKSSVFSRFQAPSSSSSSSLDVEEEEKKVSAKEEKEEDLAVQEPVKDLNPGKDATPET
jgi:hypothetical protein